MNSSTTVRCARAYILQEIIVGLVIFAIAMLPIVRGLRLLPDLGAAIGEQSRREAWRSAADQAVIEGLDPAQTALMHAVTSAEATHALVGTVSRSNLENLVGRPQISVLSAAYDESAEGRAAPAGFEIGAGTAPVPPRLDPLPPLPPIKLTAPLLSPNNGSLVPVFALSPPASAADPFTFAIQASGGAGDLVRIHANVPSLRDASGLGYSALTTDALELAQSLRGQVWAEYSGDAALDIPVDLGDGRTRWLVKSGPRFQVYEPSDPLDFVFGLDIGRPAYSVSGVEHPSGGTVAIDYFTALGVEAGSNQAIITFPEEVRIRFGAQWPRVAPGFTWSFGNHPGDSAAGNTETFFTAPARSLWGSSQTLTATPQSGLAGLRLLSGSWTVERKSTVLQPPERMASYYDGLTDAPGGVEFSSPVLAELRQRVGRPEVNAVQSVNESLTVPLVP